MVHTEVYPRSILKSGGAGRTTGQGKSTRLALATDDNTSRNRSSRSFDNISQQSGRSTFGMGNPDQQSFASVLGRTGQWNPNANGYQNTFASGYQYGPMPSQQPRRIISNLDTPDQQSFASVFNSAGQLNPNANGFQHTFASGYPYGPLPSSQYPVYQPYHPDIGWSYPTTGPKVLRQTPMKPTAGTFGHNAPTKRDRDWEDTGKKLARMYTGSRYGEDHDYQSIMQTVPTEHLTYTNGKAIGTTSG